MTVLKEMEPHDSFQKKKMELHVEAEFLSTSIMATLFSLRDCFCNQDLYIYILPYLADRLILQYLPAVNKHFYAQTYYYI